MPEIDIISPDGKLGTIPEEQKSAALAAGYTLPLSNQQPAIPPMINPGETKTDVDVISPDGKLGTIPLSQAKDAKAQGYKLPGDPGFDYGIKVHNLLSKDQKEIDQTYTPDQFMKEDGKLKTYNELNENEKALVDALQRKEVNSIESTINSASRGAADTVSKLAKLVGPQFVDPSDTTAQQNHEQAIDKEHQDMLTDLQQPAPSEKTPFELARRIAMNKDTDARKGGLATKFGETAPYIIMGGPLGELAGPIEGTAARFLAGEGASALRTGAAELAGKAIGGAIEMSPQALVQAQIDKDTKGAAETLLLGATLKAGLGLFGKGLEAVATNTGKEAQAAVQASALDQGLERLGLAEKEVSTMTQEAKLSALENIVSKGKNVEQTVEELSRGKGLQSIAGKLDEFSSIPASKITPSLAGFAERASSLGVQNDIEALTNGYSKTLEKITDKSGNIALSDLLKFVEDTGKKIDWASHDTDLINQIKKEMFDLTRNQVLDAGQQAVTNSGAKYADLWNKEVATMNVADKLHNALLAGKIDGKLDSNMIFDFAKKMVEHKLEYAAAGLAHGIPVIGPMLAGTAVKSAIKFAKSYAGNSENGSKLGSQINKLINSQNSSLPSYLAMDAIHAGANQVAKIEPFLKNIGKAGVSFSSVNDGLKHTLGDHANGLSKEQQFSALQNQIAKLQSPEVRQAHINDLVSPFAKDHPALADQMAKDYENKIQYLHQIMPKNPNPPKPFQKDDKWKPNKAELDDFNQQLKVANNPFVLLDNLKDGTVTAKQVATASTLNPAILNHIQNKINEMAYSGKIDLNYKQRLNASLIMGTAMDDSLRNVQQLQAIYATPQPQNSQPVKQATKGGSHIKADKLPSMLSQGQRLQGK